mgnify:CR=1 FL=1
MCGTVIISLCDVGSEIGLLDNSCSSGIVDCASGECGVVLECGVINVSVRPQFIVLNVCIGPGDKYCTTLMGIVILEA